MLSAAIDEAAAVGDARLEAFARVRRAYVGTFTGEKLKAALVEAQAAAGTLERFDDQAMLAQAHWAVGVFHFWLGDCAAAERALRRALDHARRGGRSRDAGEVLSSLVMVARHGPTRVPEAIRLCETTLEQARGSHSKLEAQALLSAGVLSAMRGTFDEARATVRQAGAITRDLARLDWAGGAMESARVELLAGDPAAAELVAREGYDELERLGDRGYLSTIAPILARAVYLQGRVEEAEQLTRVSEGAADPDDVTSQSGWRSVRALALARRGMTEEAVSLAREAVMIMERTDLLDSRAEALLDLAEVLRLGGRASEAATAASEALRLWEQKGSVVSAELARRLLHEVRPLRSVRSSARAAQDPP